MDKRSVVFTHSYSRMSKKSIIRMESEDPNVKTYLNKLAGTNIEVTNEDKFFKLFINSLRKSNRNFNDNQIVVKYIQGMNEFSDMLKVYMQNYMDLVHIISQTMKYEFHLEKHILFKYGDKGEQFYVILQGSVDILVAKDLKMMMSEEEYVHYLEKLDFYEEYHLINNCVTANRSVFPFDIKQANSSKTVKKQFISRRSVVIKDFISILSELDRDKIYSIDYQGYIDRIKPIHNKEKVTKDTRLIEVRVWQYYHVLNMKTGGYFGDSALLSIDQKR
jgi:CRP-like cAMP-binding protein